MPYLSDPSMVPRIEKYLETKPVGARVDLDQMADDLQRTYKEYARRKRSAFRVSVRKAHSIIIQKQGVGPAESSDEEILAEEEGETRVTDNLMHKQMIELYTRRPPTNDGELIDLSSGDSDGEIAKRGNGTPQRPFNSKVPHKMDTSRKRKLESPSGSLRKKSACPSSFREPTYTLKDVGGMDKTLEEVCRLLLHIKHPELYRKFGNTPPRGFLLHGPPGCGKTLLANAIAGELGVPSINVAAPELVAGVSGESEERIRELFERAIGAAPCVLFIDEIDAITPNRQNAQKEMERRIVAQLLICLDGLGKKENGDMVVVIGATNRPDSIDPALRRAGRFDREICMGIPDARARVDILKVLTAKLPLERGFDYEKIARNTPGYVGVDLLSLTRESSMVAINRVFNDIKEKRDDPDKPIPTPLEELIAWLHDATPIPDEYLRDLTVTMEDFERATKKVQPSAKREGFATVPDTTWNDVGSLKDLKKKLQMAILVPVRHPELCETFKMDSAAGILLCGPPGCGKTLLAKAVANEAGINFISVKGPELLNMYFGESERAVRVCFERARNSAPCVVFFDELDALCPKRSDAGENGAAMRVVNQMLTEMDGLEGRRGVFVLAATNRPDIIDPAMLRPGRLEKVLYVGLPSKQDRVDILRTVTKDGTSPPLDCDVDLAQIGGSERTEGYTGADLAALVREVSALALEEYMAEGDGSKPRVVGNRHFERALAQLRPSVSEKDRKYYDKLRKMYAGGAGQSAQFLLQEK
ncbi:nuclear valosin-containing protein-like [Cylas formicarius]|uniref:nuclear valosin-containing protein-like n=1 Tax=Cylas formicarius TaxID=197179 RepID=UPI002958CD87|nr:nuclear valosin-containing protein-like [Cylas formicarius]